MAVRHRTAARLGATPLGLVIFASVPQGGSFLATLGFVAESLWDSAAPPIWKYQIFSEARILVEVHGKDLIAPAWKI